MLTDNEAVPNNLWGWELDPDPRCEFCDRSIVTRFGGIPSNECDSCAADFKRYCDAHGGMIEVVPDET